MAFGPQNLGLPAGVVQQRVNLALEQVGALALGDRSPHRLSGCWMSRARLSIPGRSAG